MPSPVSARRIAIARPIVEHSDFTKAVIYLDMTPNYRPMSPQCGPSLLNEDLDLLEEEITAVKFQGSSADRLD